MNFNLDLCERVVAGCLSFRIAMGTKSVGSIPIKGPGLISLRVLSMCANSKGTKFAIAPWKVVVLWAACLWDCYCAESLGACTENLGAIGPHETAL